MIKPTILFAHGRESGPWGIKIRALAKVAEALGCGVTSCDHREIPDPDERVQRLIEQAADLKGPLILVGSSMGGYVVAVAAARLAPQGLFLMAPAFGLPGYADPSPRVDCDEITIVHGWEDQVIPEAAVIDFSRRHQARLHLLPAGHDLQAELAVVTRLFSLFLERQLAVSRDQNNRLLAVL